MIRVVRLLFCDEEHGTGDVMFPEDLHREIRESIECGAAASAAELRRDARKAGWRRRKGSDLCPDCAEGEGLK